VQNIAEVGKAGANSAATTIYRVLGHAGCGGGGCGGRTTSRHNCGVAGD